MKIGKVVSSLFHRENVSIIVFEGIRFGASTTKGVVKIPSPLRNSRGESTTSTSTVEATLNFHFSGARMHFQPPRCFTNLGNVVESARAVGSWSTYACNSQREAEWIDYWPGASSVNQVLIGQGKWPGELYLLLVVGQGEWINYWPGSDADQSLLIRLRMYRSGRRKGSANVGGTSGIDIDLRRLDIDQCPLPPGSTQLNIFAASDKCKKRTTECIAIPGLGFRRGSYRCICKRGFYYPDTKSPNRYYNGTVIEEEYEKLMMVSLSKENLSCISSIMVPFKVLEKKIPFKK
ncbi:hypothetical protein K0M31_008288 [Melipona bicolor]|uniref:GPR158/179 extracellular domain-containing protein n=1 Tax=Melipona bicolor TaxID=60889 RepID=A0AA40FQP9_9HYME|nr:hypothetical protein K0M31_008288 [Melipona bicolor]